MKSIGFRLTAIMLCVILLGIVITVGVAITISGSVITRESLAKIERETESTADEIDVWLNSQLDFVEDASAGLAFESDLSEKAIMPTFNRHMENHSSFFVLYLGMPDGHAFFTDGWVPDFESGWAAYKRPWYVGAMADTASSYLTDPYTDSNTEKLCISAARAVVGEGGEVRAVLSGDIFLTTLQETILEAKITDDSYTFLTGADGSVFVHPNSDYVPYLDENGDDVLQLLSNVDGGILADVWEGDSGVIVKDYDGVERIFTSRTLPSTGWTVYTAVPSDMPLKTIYDLIKIVIPITIAILVFAALLILFIVRNLVTRPISELAKAATNLAEGDIGIRVESGYQGEMGILAHAFQRIADGVDEQVHSAKAIADGDLTVDINIRSERDAIGHAFRDLLNKLNSIFDEINSSSNQVSNGSQQVAQGAQELASGSSEQAANIEELSETLTGLEQKTNQNSENSRLAQKANEKVEALITDSVNSMSEMLEAMRAIDESSKNINKVIKVIDDIAFQTNILALNAAVEAARAGQHGKGFAVVADEVRNLASKSAAAAKETAGLIEGSSQKVDEGNRLVEQTNRRLDSVAENARESLRLVNEVTAASGEQAKSIIELNQGMEQISTVVQTNSSTAEQSAAASEEMSAQAMLLNEIVARFKLKK